VKSTFGVIISGDLITEFAAAVDNLDSNAYDTIANQNNDLEIEESESRGLTRDEFEVHNPSQKNPSESFKYEQQALLGLEYLSEGENYFNAAMSSLDNADRPATLLNLGKASQAYKSARDTFGNNPPTEFTQYHQLLLNAIVEYELAADVLFEAVADLDYEKAEDAGSHRTEGNHWLELANDRLDDN
jgi:hypothetical protein